MVEKITLQDNLVLGPHIQRGPDIFNFRERAGFNDRLFLERAKFLQEEKEDLGFIDYVQDIARQDFLHNALRDAHTAEGFDFDPGYRSPDLDSPEGKVLYFGIPEELIPQVRLANSPGQARFIADRIRKELQIEQRLARFGGFGLAGRILLNFTDPSAVLIALASGPLAIASKVTRFSRFLKVGAISGGINAAFEAGIVAGRPTRDTYDILYASILGFALGGGISLFRRVPPSGLEFRVRPEDIAPFGPSRQRGGPDAGFEAEGALVFPERLLLADQGPGARLSDLRAQERFEAMIETNRRMIEREEVEIYARGDFVESTEELFDIDATVDVQGHPDINLYNPNAVSLANRPPTVERATPGGEAVTLNHGDKFLFNDENYTVAEVLGPDLPVTVFNVTSKGPLVFTNPEQFTKATGYKFSKEVMRDAQANKPKRNAITLLDDLRDSARTFGKFDTDAAIANGLLEGTKDATRKGVAGIFVKGGRGLDDLVDVLSENGYFPPADPNLPTEFGINDAVDIVRRDIDALVSGGKRTRSPNEDPNFFSLDDFERHADELNEVALAGVDAQLEALARKVFRTQARVAGDLDTFIGPLFDTKAQKQLDIEDIRTGVVISGLETRQTIDRDTSQSLNKFLSDKGNLLPDDDVILPSVKKVTGKPEVFHQTNFRDALEIVRRVSGRKHNAARRNLSSGPKGLFVSPDKDLALAQGGKTDVTLVFDAEFVSGRIPDSLANQGQIEARGEVAEIVLEKFVQGRALKGVLFKDEAGVEKFRKMLFNKTPKGMTEQQRMDRVNRILNFNEPSVKVEGGIVAGGTEEFVAVPKPKSVDPDVGKKFGRGGVGAAAAEPPDPPIVEFPSDWDIDPNNPRAVFTKARVDVSAIISGSKSPMVRSFGPLVREGVGLEGTDFMWIGASEDAIQRSDGWRNRIMQGSKPNYKGWLLAQGKSKMLANETVTHLADFNEFHDLVGRAIIGEAPLGPGSEFIDAHANQYRPIFAEALDEMVRWGVFGADEGMRNPNFFPRVANYSAWNEKIAIHKVKRLEEFFFNALIKDHPTFTERHYRALAKAYVKHNRQRAAGVDEDLSHGLNLSDEDTVRLFLDGIIPRRTIDDIVAKIKEAGELKKGEAGKPGHLKARMRFNELHEELLDSEFEGPLRVNFNDFFVRNARIGMENYIRKMSGHIAVAKKLGISGPRAFKKRLAAMEEAKNQGEEITQKQLDTINMVYHHVIGESLETTPGSFSANLGRLLRDYQYTRVGGVMGLSQMPDLGDMLSPRMFRSFLVHMPEFRAMITRAQSGQLSDTLARRLEFHGIGGDALRNNSIGRMDEQGWGTGYGTSPDGYFDMMIQKGANVAARGVRVVHFFSGMAGIDTGMRRMVGKSVLQNIVDVAFGWTPRNSRQGRFVIRRQMVANGIPEDRIDDVFAMIREHAVVVPSRLARGMKIADINMQNVTDLDLRDLLMDAIVRETNLRVLRPDIGGSFTNPVGGGGGNPLLIEGTLGKIVTQFQKFIFNAYSAKTLRAIHVRDVDTVGRFFGSMLFAGLSYVAYTYLQTSNNPERRKKMLSIDRFAAAIFARSGYSSIIPGVYDSTVGAVFEPVFSYSRSSGLAKDFFTGNPTFDSIDTAHAAFAGLIEALVRDGYQFSQKDIRNFRRIMFFQNITGISQILDALETLPPKKHKK